MVGSFPAGFLERIEALGPQTIVRIPKHLRHILCNWTAGAVLAMNKGDTFTAVLEQARCKRLLAHIRKRLNTSHELHIRFTMWHDPNFHELLTRVEEQVKMAPLQAACTAVGGAHGARRIARYGAYKKCVQSLRGKVATLSETDQLRYA